MKTLWEGHKIWQKPPIYFDILLSSVKPSGRFFQIFVAFSVNLNFINKLHNWMYLLGSQSTRSNFSRRRPCVST